MGDTGGACRLDGRIFHHAFGISTSGKENMERKKTQSSILQTIARYSQKIKMERKEIQRTVLQVLRCIFKIRESYDEVPLIICFLVNFIFHFMFAILFSALLSSMILLTSCEQSRTWIRWTSN